MKICVTGSSGLIGRGLTPCLRLTGVEVVPVDSSIKPGIDILDRKALDDALAGCDGVVHLAAVSRVKWAEANPRRCWDVNVSGTVNVIEACMAQVHRPWLLFASSREVYGEQSDPMVAEDTVLDPINVYGRSKATGEHLLHSARDAGLRTAIVRLANVYGDTDDHADRVVPSFARAAAAGTNIQVHGPSKAFDFTHVTEVVRGLCTVIDLLESGNASIPVLHLASGRATTLSELAAMALAASSGSCTIVESPGEGFEVSRFVGNVARARQVLGWMHAIPLEEGFRALVDCFKSPRAGGDRLSLIQEESPGFDDGEGVCDIGYNPAFRG